MTQHQTPPAPDHSHGDTPPPPPPAPKPRRRWLPRSLLSLAAFFLLLCGSIVWLVGTESGLRLGLLRLPALFGVQIQADNPQGTLWRGFALEKTHINTGGSQISLDSLVLDWDSSALWQRQLHIRRLAVGEIHIVSQASPPKPDQPAATLPKSISLPVAVNVDALELGGITVGEPKQVVLLPSRASYVYDHQNHRLHIAALRTPWHNVQGDISLNTASPFALHGQLSGEGLLDEQAVNSEAALSGSLETPELVAHMHGGPIQLQTDAKLKPFALQLNHKIISLNLLGRQLNPHAFLPSLPKADVDFSIGMAPNISHGDELDGIISLSNRTPAAADAGGLPLRLLTGQLKIDSQGQLNIHTLDAQLMQKGSINVRGKVNTAERQLDIIALLQNLRSQDVLTSTLPGSLNGSIHVHGSLSSPQTDWQFATEKAHSSGTLQLLTDQASAQQTLLLEKLQLLPRDGGVLNASGSLALFQQRALELKVDSQNFNPNKLNDSFPSGRVNGNINIKGTLADSPDISGQMQWQNSVLSGAPLAGKADVRYQNQHLSRADINLALGRNRIVSNGSFGKAGDKLNLDINAPQLDLFGFGLKGLLTAKGFISGEPKKLTANLSGQARGLEVQNVLQAQTLDFALQGSPDVTQPLNIRINGQTLNAGGTRIERINTLINGRGNSHTISADAQLQLDGKPYRLDIAANGGLNEQYQWRGRVGTLDIGGAFNLKLLAPLQLEAGAERVVMNNARWAAMGGTLNLQSLLWDKKQGLTTRGNASNLAVQQLHNIMPLPIEQNLVLGGDWDLSYSDNARGYLKIQQQSGDIILPYRKQALGLNKVVLDTRFQNGRIDNHLSGDTRYGNVDARVAIAQQFGNDILKAPVSGHIKVNAPDLANFRYLMPVGMEARGSLAADAAVSGTVGTPLLNGSLNGNNLYYRERANGVILENGTLRSRFQGRRLLIEALNFKRKDGDITLKGVVNMVGTTPDVDVTAQFSRYPILDQVNRRLTLSGHSQLIYTLSRGIILTGELKVDQGHFGFPKAGMPTLGDDVVVLGREKPADSAALPVSLNMALDLNDKFRFSGEGLDVLLGGRLVATSDPGKAFQLVGSVNIIKGQYKAYGQDLVIQQGSISFVGPIDDPNLRLRATRRSSPVDAGVEALGSLSNPRISLTANEPMSEKDKLSWLILGRASSGSAGDEAALSAAASAWLAGGINDRLGLVDELGFTSQQTRDSQTGEMNPAEQVITVGKRLTNDLYVSYLYGIASATQTVKLTYQINRALQAIGKVGTESVGGEIRYSIRFD